MLTHRYPCMREYLFVTLVRLSVLLLPLSGFLSRATGSWRACPHKVYHQRSSTHLSCLMVQKGPLFHRSCQLHFQCNHMMSVAASRKLRWRKAHLFSWVHRRHFEICRFRHVHKSCQCPWFDIRRSPPVFYYFHRELWMEKMDQSA